MRDSRCLSAGSRGRLRAAERCTGSERGDARGRIGTKREDGDRRGSASSSDWCRVRPVRQVLHIVCDLISVGPRPEQQAVEIGREAHHGVGAYNPSRPGPSGCHPESGVSRMNTGGTRDHLCQVAHMRLQDILDFLLLLIIQEHDYSPH